ncbi:heme-binding domain-containing protein [Niabella aurantiaca]|uniref:heme-binding domain-containing protein n=1 Tax=Niabella aurantiaca TaxID=379900 RepID=UPI000367CB17|nr:heme-binding domain-containing protein [Niabella aurantiaca]
MFKKIGWALLTILVVIQFIRPAKNEQPVIAALSINTKYPADTAVRRILQKACNDCHSNHTNYPWYSKIQPVYWWLNGHIKDGKRHLNFDAFTNRPAWSQYHKLEEIQEMIDKNEMPLASYTWIHKDAVLTQAEKEQLLTWVKTAKADMQRQYPKDSLVRPPRKK